MQQLDMEQLMDVINRIVKRTTNLELDSVALLEEELARQERIVALTNSLHNDLGNVRKELDEVKDDVREANTLLAKLIILIKGAVKKEEYDKLNQAVDNFGPEQLATRKELATALRDFQQNI